MPDLGAYYANIKETKRKLDAVDGSGFVFVISVQNFQKNSIGGVVAEVSTAIAARHLVDGTGAVASTDDIAAFRAQGAAFSARMATQSFNRKKSDSSSSGVTFTLTK